jgi:hypothetical protein
VTPPRHPFTFRQWPSSTSARSSRSLSTSPTTTTPSGAAYSSPSSRSTPSRATSSPKNPIWIALLGTLWSRRCSPSSTAPSPPGSWRTSCPLTRHVRHDLSLRTNSSATRRAAPYTWRPPSASSPKGISRSLITPVASGPWLTTLLLSMTPSPTASSPSPSYRALSCSLVTTLSPGPPSASIRCPAPVPRTSIALLPMVSLKLVGYVSYCRSFRSLFVTPPLFTATMSMSFTSLQIRSSTSAQKAC